MSWRDAPLYVLAHDLTVDLDARHENWAGRRHNPVGDALVLASVDLLTEVSLALLHPQTRPVHLESADHAVARLRVLLRVARDRGMTRPGAYRALARKVDECGKMVGGLRKRERRRQAASTTTHHAL